jgi:hypothetical protein
MASSEVRPIDEEIRCLLNKLIDSTGPVWDGSVILRLKVVPAGRDWWVGYPWNTLLQDSNTRNTLPFDFVYDNTRPRAWSSGHRRLSRRTRSVKRLYSGTPPPLRGCSSSRVETTWKLQLCSSNKIRSPRKAIQLPISVGATSLSASVERIRNKTQIFSRKLQQWIPYCLRTRLDFSNFDR